MQINLTFYELLFVLIVSSIFLVSLAVLLTRIYRPEKVLSKENKSQFFAKEASKRLGAKNELTPEAAVANASVQILIGWKHRKRNKRLLPEDSPSERFAAYGMAQALSAYLVSEHELDPVTTHKILSMRLSNELPNKRLGFKIDEFVGVPDSEMFHKASLTLEYLKDLNFYKLFETCDTASICTSEDEKKDSERLAKLDLVFDFMEKRLTHEFTEMVKR